VHAARLPEACERLDRRVPSFYQTGLGETVAALELDDCAECPAVDTAVDTDETIAAAVRDNLYVEQPLYGIYVVVPVAHALFRIPYRTYNIPFQFTRISFLGCVTMAQLHGDRQGETLHPTREGFAKGVIFTTRFQP
jgi:hypothetical protein